MPTYNKVFNSHEVSDTLMDKLQSLPKVELHVHLEGATSPETYFRIAARNGIMLPVDGLNGWKAYCEFDDFKHFISVYENATSCIRRSIDFTEMILDFAENQAHQNVVYTEVYLSTSLHLGKLSHHELLDAIEKGVARAEDRFESRLRFIPDISRERPHQQEEILAFAIEAAKRGVGIGLGLGGIESGYPPRLFQRTYDEARKAGLHLLVHAGETIGAESIGEAVELLDPERIGHGIRVIDDPTLTEVLVERQLPFEVSPQSNYCTRVIELDLPHPIRMMKAKGLFCTINSDDPSMFSTSLNNEYLTLAAQGFSFEELVELDKNAVRASFMAETEKASTLKKIDDSTQDS